MSFLNVRSVVAFAVLTGLVACTAPKSETETASGSVRVRLPIVDKDGVNSIGEKTLAGLTSLAEVSGAYAQFIFAPRITEQGLVGFAPRAKFMKTGSGVFVPADEQSQHLAAIYSQFEDLFRLDQEMGLGDVLTWPRVVGISVRLLTNGQVVTDNAFYDGGSDAILVVPYKNGLLPLAMNPGVLGHEHFHALFDRLVLRPLLEKNAISRRMNPSNHPVDVLSDYFEKLKIKTADIELDKGESADLMTRTVLVKSVNEGLADVWGWVHSGDTEFVGRSLPKFKTLRDLKAMGAGPQPLVPATAFRAAVTQISHTYEKPESVLNDFAYYPAAQLAKALVDVWSTDQGDLTPDEVRREAGHRLIEALPVIVDALTTSKVDAGDMQGLFARILKARVLTDAQKSRASLWAPGGFQ